MFGVLSYSTRSNTPTPGTPNGPPKISPIPGECECTRKATPTADLTEPGPWSIPHQRILRLANEIAPTRGPFVIFAGEKRESTELKSWYTTGRGRPQLQQRLRKFELFQRVLVEMPPPDPDFSSQTTLLAVRGDRGQYPHAHSHSQLLRAESPAPRGEESTTSASPLIPRRTGTEAQGALSSSSRLVDTPEPDLDLELDRDSEDEDLEPDAQLEVWDSASRGHLVAESARTNTPTLAYSSLLNILQRTKALGSGFGENVWNGDAWAAQSLCSACGKASVWAGEKVNDISFDS